MQQQKETQQAKDLRRVSFRNFRINVTVRVVGICLTTFALVYLIKASGLFMTVGFVGLLIVYQVYALINLMENTNREMLDFLSSIKYDDFSHSYKLTGRGGTFDLLNQEFNNVLNRFKEIRAEKEAEYQYLKNIIHHIRIGILSFDRNGDVQIMNTAAKRLFKVNRLRNISKLEEFSPELLETFQQLKTGSKALVRVRNGGEIVQLAVYAIELYLKGEEFKLVTIQNIHSELEDQEMDAWQNLIRVLTHEIMNSVTPISSLANTVESELEELAELPEEERAEYDLEDIQMAVQTIRRRSEALIRFVNEFRSLTHVPVPRLAHVRVDEIFEHLQTLMQHECDQHNIELRTEVDPTSLMITADKDQIEQVLINLIKNAAQALQEMGREDNPRKKIIVSAHMNAENRPVIKVTDNGPGIDKDAMDRIFIPFFTTKKAGSGIGLSISRQIMRQHKGTITVRSSPEEGTEFSLQF